MSNALWVIVGAVWVLLGLAELAGHRLPAWVVFVALISLGVLLISVAEVLP